MQKRLSDNLGKRKLPLLSSGKKAKAISRKEDMKICLYLDYEGALTLADDDIHENWEIYREKFLRGDIP